MSGPEAPEQGQASLYCSAAKSLQGLSICLLIPSGYADEVRKERNKALKKDVALRLAGMIHKVSL